MTPFAVVDAAPAGGAAAAQVAIGAAVSALVVGSLFALGLRHQARRTDALAWTAHVVGLVAGLPGRAALPGAVALLGFLVAGVGFVWDVAFHVDQGRDTGPFGTPAHYLLLAGIYALFAAGWLAICLPRGGRRAGWISVGRWDAPPAGIAMLVCAVVAMAGFPLDDVWHRLFGQDVTLWGPTHLMMICGGLFVFFGLVLLVHEAREDARAGKEPRPRTPRLVAYGSNVLAAAIALGGLTVAFQQEFAFGVPQFRLLFHPALIAFSAAAVLVPARLLLGRGGAIATALTTVGLLGGLTLAVGPILGEGTHHFPLYLAEAAAVELAALTRARRWTYGLAVAAGALIGSLGVLAEWGWSQLWMPLPWPGHLLAEAIARSVPLAIAGGVIGTFVAAGLRAPPRPAILRPRGWTVPAAALAVAVLSFAALLPTHAAPLRADVALSGAIATVRMHPAGAADGADWFYVMAWQGQQHRSVVARLRRAGADTWRTREPIPLGGVWKTFLRLHRGSLMASVPISMPADSAIPAAAVPAPPRFTRAFVSDRRLLQRERRHDVPGWLFGAASAAVAAVILALLALLGWTLQCQARGAPPRRPRRLAPRAILRYRVGTSR